jgi:hypothetical protein
MLCDRIAIVVAAMGQGTQLYPDGKICELYFVNIFNAHNVFNCETCDSKKEQS